MQHSSTSWHANCKKKQKQKTTQTKKSALHSILSLHILNKIYLSWYFMTQANKLIKKHLLMPMRI